MLTGVVGSSFLKKHFSAFSGAKFRSCIINLNSDEKNKLLLRQSLESIASLLSSSTVQSSLLITGELYKVCSYLLDAISPTEEESVQRTLSLDALASVDGALQLIYYDYKKNRTIDEAALATGYGKSYFCKIFKKATGMSFHEALNRKRIELACGLLSDTSLSVSEISEEVGFTETKSFCRVFKSHIGTTPGAYRQKDSP